jgi:hypothetical protein
MEILGFVAALLMGVIMGLVGGGGSILTVPILVYFFNQDAMSATTGSMFVVGISAIFGATIYFKQGHVDFKKGLKFALPGLFGVVFGRHFLLPLLPDQLNFLNIMSLSKSAFVLMAFSVTMIAAAFSLLNPKISKSSTHPHLFKFIFQGFLVGCLTGFVGAGGGFLIGPALIAFARLPMRVAVGTSLVIISINSLFGFTISLQAEPVNWLLFLKVAFIGVIGLLIGILFSNKVNESFLKKGFGYMILVVGGFVLTQQIFSN